MRWWVIPCMLLVLSTAVWAGEITLQFAPEEMTALRTLYGAASQDDLIAKLQTNLRAQIKRMEEQQTQREIDAVVTGLRGAPPDRRQRALDLARQELEGGR